MSAFSAIFKSVNANDLTSIGDALLPLDPAILPAGISFDPTTNSFALDTSAPSYIALADGQTSSVTLNYAAPDGTPTSVELTLTGVNEAPIVTGPVTGLFVNESGLGAAYDVAALLSTAHDPDSTDKLSVVFNQSACPPA